MDDPLGPLREALRLSPDNVPLRAHVAAELLRLGRAAEAEAEYRRALALVPADPALELGLSEAFLAQGKNGEAAVVAEALAARPARPPRALLVWARALARLGETAEAARRYREAVRADAALADDAFAATLGLVGADDEEGPSPVIGGRIRLSAGDEDDGPDIPEMERPAVTFADVGGWSG